MNCTLAGIFLTIAFVGSAAAASAAPEPATPSPQLVATTQIASAPVNYTAECKALGLQWSGAMATHASDTQFAKAKAGAVRGERNCTSTNVAKHKKGAGQYEAALKLLGITPAV